MKDLILKWKIVWKIILRYFNVIKIEIIVNYSNLNNEIKKLNKEGG